MSQNDRPGTRVLYGDMLTEADLPPRNLQGKDNIHFVSTDMKVMSMTPEQLSRHTLLIGGIGSGKTNCFNLILRNLNARMKMTDVMLIFDTKGDFYQEFYQEGLDYVIANAWEYQDQTVFWNIFREIEMGGRLRSEKELTAKEIAKALFEDRKNNAQPFFSDAACDIFGKTLIYKMRTVLWDTPAYLALEQRLSENRRNAAAVEECIRMQWELFENEAWQLNNRVLTQEILQRWTAQDYAKMLRSYPDFQGAVSYIGDGTSNQALGVMGELNSMINDYFIGVFADYEPGRDVAMRELIRGKGKARIFIEYDLSIGQVLCSLYRLLVDLALKEALGRSRSEGNVYLVIDEFKLLPKLTHLDDALNFGRSLGIKAFVGIQSIGQLKDVYGETAGDVIAAGFSNVMAFRMTDEASRSYVSELFGHNYTVVSYENEKQSLTETQREGHCVEGWQLMDLKIGQAVVGLVGYRPFYFQFKEYKRDVLIW